MGRAGTGQGNVHWTANFDEIQDFEHDMRGPFGGTGFLPLTPSQFAALHPSPASGKAAVDTASSVGDLREGRLSGGTERVRVVGSHTFYLVEGTWTRDDFETDDSAREVEVGSPEFLALIAESPEIADAATLGERVVTEGPDGWITIVWPDL